MTLDTCYIVALYRSVIERDAMAIFTKYLSLDCSHPVAVSDDLRVATVKLMCHDDGVNTDCFNACQQAVLRILDKEYVCTYVPYRRGCFSLQIIFLSYAVEVMRDNNRS